MCVGEGRNAMPSCKNNNNDIVFLYTVKRRFARSFRKRIDPFSFDDVVVVMILVVLDVVPSFTSACPQRCVMYV